MIKITDVYVSKCDEYNKDKIKKVILKSFSELNINISKFKKNSKILIKPNILGQRKPEEAVTTHPIIVEAILDILVNDYSEKKFNIILGESSGVFENKGTEKAYKISGIEDAAKKYGIKCVPFEISEKVKIETKHLKEEYYLKELTFAQEIIDSDIIINLPKLKTHVLMDYTGAIKNFFGLISGNQKVMYHVQAPNKKRFSKILADIYTFVKSNNRTVINIMDGILGMEGNGPANGNPKKSNLILVSLDSFALDIVASNIIGFETLNLAFVRELLQRKINPFPVNQKGLTKISVPFKKPLNVSAKVPDFIKKAISSLMIIEPIIDQNKCKKCLVCYNHCPAKTIKVINKKIKEKDGTILKKIVKIDLNKCIHCFCCHELCPHDAINLKRRHIFKFSLFLKYLQDKLSNKNNKEKLKE